MVGLSIGIDPSYRESDAMASFVARPGAWPARSTARLQPSGWAARSAKLLAALLMSQRLMCDVDMVEEQQLRQLEGDAAGGPPTLPESMAVPLTPGGASSAPCTRSKH